MWPTHLRWPLDRPDLLAQIRSAVHIDRVTESNDEFFGPGIRTCLALAEVAGPGQVLVSGAVANSQDDRQGLRDLGVHRLRGLSPPMRIFELVSGVAKLEQILTVDRVPNNLPVHLSSFVGRTQEVNALVGSMRTTKLVTVCGPGGSGKSRLAARSTAELVQEHSDGVWWVELAGVADDTVVSSLAKVLGVSIVSGEDTSWSLVAQLSDKKMLVCIDNCEHVLASVASIVRQIVAACPDVKIVTTGREPLDVEGELVWRVPVLDTRHAVELFVERMGEARLAIGSDETMEVVEQICARLDGIPLAIELAASWSSTLLPEAILSGLESRF